MLAREPVIDIAGGPRAWRAQIYDLGNGLYIDRLLLVVDTPGDWRAALAMARSWHFFFAWMFVVNGIVYIAYSAGSRHLTRDLAPTSFHSRRCSRALHRDFIE